MASRIVLRYYGATKQLTHKKWSGWQELNLRGHAPKACGWPLPYTRTVGEGLSALPGLSLHADHLAQRVYYVNQVALRFHHGIDGLVRHRRFVDDVRVLTALDAGCCLGVVVQCEAALRLRTRHGTSGSMAAAHEAFRVTLAPHDVRTRSHAAGNDSYVTLTRADGALARDKHVLAILVLPGHVGVMATYDFHTGLERGNFSRALYRRDHIPHHQIAVRQGVVLRPVHRADVVLEVLRALWQVGKILVRQVDHPLAHILLRQLNEKRAKAIAYATRSRMQQEPNVLALIETDLDEVVPRTQRSQVINALHMVQLGILVDNRLVR